MTRLEERIRTGLQETSERIPDTAPIGAASQLRSGRPAGVWAGVAAAVVVLVVFGGVALLTGGGGDVANESLPTSSSVPAQPHEFLDGEVTFGAVPSWDYSWAGWEFSPTMTTLLLDGAHEERLVLLADPQPIGTGCVKAPVPIDANALASSLRSDPDLEVTEPVPARIAGIEGLQVDVVSATSGNLCEEVGVPGVVAGGTATGLEPGQRMRLYLIDYPGGSAQVLAIAIVAPEDRFESVLEAAIPTLDSVEFHAP